MACMARRGFLTLRECENPEARSCDACGRPMCTEHLSARSGFTRCLECAAPAFNEADENYDSDWAYGYRRDYYQRTGYQPIDFAAAGVAASSPYWDGVDRRAFRAGAQHDLDDESRSGSFGES
jgi:hypothetical protein